MSKPPPDVNPDDAPPLPAVLALDKPPLDEDALAVTLGRANPDDLLEPPTSEDLAQIERWTITDDEVAEWAMRKMAAAAARIDEREAQGAAWRARIDEWEESVTRADRRTVEWFGGHLADYAVRERERDEGRKSIPLPSGALTTTKPTKPRVVVVDDEAAARWVYANVEDKAAAELVKVTHKVYAGIAAHIRAVEHEDGTWSAVDADGEPVPGVVVEAPRVKPKVTPR